MFWFSFFLAFASSNLSGDSEDHVFVDMILRGQVDGMEKLYDKYSNVLNGMLYKIVHDKIEAEDLLQEVFVQVWDRIESYENSRGSVFNWLVTIARNKAIDRIRSKIYKTRVRESTELNDIHFEIDDDEPDPLENSIIMDRAKIVRDALKQIPDEQKEVIEIAYFQGMSQSEIAEQLQLPLGTVKSRMRQGMMKIRELLKSTIS